MDQFEQSVQRFLAHISIPCHTGLGGPARRVELLGIRIKNRDKDKRNFFIDKRRAMFIIFYHKMLHVHDTSRFPVRVLMHKVARLLVQYLVVVMPIRNWLLRTREEKVSVSSYSWLDAKGIWTEDRWSRVFT